MFVQREITAEAFLAFAEQHPDKRFDFIDGEVVEEWRKPRQGRIQAAIGAEIVNYAEQHLNLTAYLTALHVLGDEKFMPDVCVNEYSEADYLTTPPLFVVEIRSDSQSR